jgi:YesN/AraC family two-component response regulator
MAETRIYIKNMVCPRCIRIVKEELHKAGYQVKDVQLGSAIIQDTVIDRNKLAGILKENGFELLEEKSAKLINEIKVYIISYIRNGKIEDDSLKLSSRLEEHFRKDYSYMSHIFSISENTTLEKYIIAQKIELVKEWLVYDELTLSEIADQLGYSSVAYLSNQFKKVTGLTPGHFRQVKENKRKPLDQI